MGVCWYCYWGWAKPVADIYKQAVEKLGGDEMPLLYGPAHIVWDDENWDCVDWCLKNFDKYKGDNSDKDLDIVRWSLKELAKIPLDKREIEPDDYDDMNPQNYPPAKGIVTVKV